MNQLGAKVAFFRGFLVINQRNYLHCTKLHDTYNPELKSYGFITQTLKRNAMPPLTLLFFYLGTSILLSCSNPENTIAATPTEISPTNTENTMESITSSLDSLILQDFDSKQLPSEIQYKGKLVDGAHWIDNNGEHYLVISDLTKGEPFSKGYTSNIYGTCYQKKDQQWTVYWSIKEFNQGVWESTVYTDQSLSITDLDQDGLAESCFHYRVTPDGLDPERVKVLMHVKGEKYGIRGQLGAEAASLDELEIKNIDPKFKNIAPIFQEHASKTWDNYRNWLYKRIVD